MITKRYHFDRLDSTNKKAKELAEAGCEQGTLITAETQEAGVGRRGRSWSSEQGTGIYMSMVLRPEIPTDNISMLTLLAALAVTKALKEEGVLSEEIPSIKWPNDVVLHKKKICGILTELGLERNQPAYVIIGIGVNVTNQAFPEELSETASSILLETGRKIDREQLIRGIWKAFEEYYEIFLQTQDFSQLQAEYEKNLLNKNQQVKVLDPLGSFEGTAMGITKKGELLVDTGTEPRVVSSGEVSVRGIYGYV